MKGLSKFVEYTFIIMFGFVLLSILTSMIYHYYNKNLETNINVGLKQIALQTSDGILKLYQIGEDVHAEPTNGTATIITSIDMNYPNHIGGKNYEVILVSSLGIWTQVTDLTIDSEDIDIRKEEFSGAKIIVRTTQNPYLSYEHSLPNIPVAVQGKYTSGMNDTLTYVRYNYLSTEYNAIILGEFDFVVDITVLRSS